MHVIYQTLETVFQWDIQIPRRELKKTMPSGIFLMKFEVFGRQTFTLQKLEHLRNIQSLHGLNDSKLLCSIPQWRAQKMEENCTHTHTWQKLRLHNL